MNCEGSQRDWDVRIRRPQYDHDIDIEYFVPFVDKIFVWHIDRHKFLNPGSRCHMLKHLRVRDTNFNTVKIDRMKRFLGKLEYLKLIWCKMDESFLENLLHVSPNLKRLCITDSNSSTGQKWLEHNYPTLEHCEIDSTNTAPITTLLVHNPNIRKFGTTSRNIWENRFLIKDAVIDPVILNNIPTISATLAVHLN